MAPTNEFPNSTKAIFTKHGFDAFINCDDSVSAYIPTATDGKFSGYELVTAQSKKEAYIHCGY